MKHAASLATAIALGCIVQPAAADPMRPLVLPPAANAAASGPAPTPTPTAGQPAPATAAPGAAAATPATPVLSAIRQDSAGRWQALFGERWLAVGDRLEGQVLTGIDGNTVRVGRGAGERTLQLLPVLQATPPLAAQAPPRRHAKTFASDTRTP